MFYNKARNSLVVFLSLSSLCFSACDKINVPDPVPTYIHIDSFLFKKNPKVLADSLMNINAVWVYYNGNAVGEFDLPATFPVIASGVGQLMLMPAIPFEGQNDHEGNYPFYTNDTFTFNALPGKVITHVPVTGYYTATKITSISDFIGITGFSNAGGTVGMVLNTADALKYHGQTTGGIFLNLPGDSSIIVSNNPVTITANENFIEFDYKSTVPFSINLQPDSGAYSGTIAFIAGVMPAKEWQKFYVYVSGYAGKTQGETYNLYIKAVLPPEQQNGAILLANLNLLSFGQ